MQGFCIVVLLLAIAREICPSIAFSAEEKTRNADSIRQVKPFQTVIATSEENDFHPHRIYSVPGFDSSFPDGNDVQLEAAMRLGVQPIADREEAERKMDELVYVGSNPYFFVEKAQSSIPYLVPSAARLLQDIGSSFFDSLQIKGVPLHKIIVTSVLRTQDDVRKLQTHNLNATTNSCHQYATTFDICYNRYKTVADPAGPSRHAVTNDTLKWVLSEVLLELRQQGRCYVKHEKKQGCYHITVRE